MFHSLYSESLDDIMDDLIEKLYNYNLSVWKKSLEHWCVSSAGFIVYFDPKNDPKDLALLLAEPIEKNIKNDTVFALKIKKIWAGHKSKDNQLHKRSFAKNKRKLKISIIIFISTFATST